MRNNRRKFPEIADIIGILVSIFAGFISFYAQSQDPQTAIVLFLALLGAILLFFLISYPFRIFKERINQLDQNTKEVQKVKEDLNMIKDKLNFRRDIEDLKLRISKLENNRK